MTEPEIQSDPPTADQLIEQALRAGIQELMQQCSEKQNAFLRRIHASSKWGSLEKCPRDKLGDTYDLLRRTVIKNRKDPERLKA